MTIPKGLSISILVTCTRLWFRALNQSTPLILASGDSTPRTTTSNNNLEIHRKVSPTLRLCSTSPIRPHRRGNLGELPRVYEIALLGACRPSSHFDLHKPPSYPHSRVSPILRLSSTSFIRTDHQGNVWNNARKPQVILSIAYCPPSHFDLRKLASCYHSAIRGMVRHRPSERTILETLIRFLAYLKSHYRWLAAQFRTLICASLLLSHTGGSPQY